MSIVRGDFKQPRLEVVFPAPSFEHIDSTALDLAAFGLGSGEMSRLNRRLRDDEGVVTSIGSSVYSPSFGGLFEVSALAPLASLPLAAERIAAQIAILRTSEPIREDELSRARANLKADRIFRDETVDGQARSLGFGLRTSQKLVYDEVYTAQVNAMPVADVACAVRRWLKPELASLVALVGEDDPMTEAELRQAFRRGFTAGAQAPDKSREAATGRRVVAERTAEIFQLKSGIRLIYRHNPNVELFTLTAATGGGLRAEDARTAGLYNAMSGLFATASAQRSYEETVSAVEDFGASFEGFSGKDSVGYHLQCLTEQVRPMLALFRESLLTPAFPEEQWSTLQREIEQALRAQQDSPASMAVRRYQEIIYGDHPYRFPITGLPESVAHFTAATLQQTYLEMLPRGLWVMAVATTLPADEVVHLLEEALAGFDPGAQRRTFASARLAQPTAGGAAVLPKEREQTHLVYGFRGLTWDDPGRPALDVLVNVLGGHGGRLFRTLRDRDSLAYTVSPLISYGVDPGAVGSYIACAPAKADQALAALEAEMLRLTEVEPTSVEVERARAHIIGTHEMGLQKSDALTSTMALMELYGYGYDDFQTYPRRIAEVDSADVLRVAKRLFQPDKAVRVRVGPD